MSAYKPRRKPKTLCPLERIANLEMEMSCLRQRIAELEKPKPKPAPIAIPAWKTEILNRGMSHSANTHSLAY